MATNLEMLVDVINLGCLTNDRTKGEQKALLHWARKVDRERNSLASSNPRAKEVVLCPGDWNPYIPPPESRRYDRNDPAITRLVSADNKDRHPKVCICRGNGVLPAVGPSMLEAYVIETWEPSE